MEKFRVVRADANNLVVAGKANKKLLVVGLDSKGNLLWKLNKDDRRGIDYHLWVDDRDIYLSTAVISWNEKLQLNNKILFLKTKGK